MRHMCNFKLFVAGFTSFEPRVDELFACLYTLFPTKYPRLKKDPDCPFQGPGNHPKFVKTLGSRGRLSLWTPTGRTSRVSDSV